METSELNNYHLVKALAVAWNDWLIERIPSQKGGNGKRVTRILWYFLGGVLNRKFPTWESPFLPLLRSDHVKTKTLGANPCLLGLILHVLGVGAAVNTSRSDPLSLNQNTRAQRRNAGHLGQAALCACHQSWQWFRGLAIKREPLSLEFKKAD